MKKYLCVVFILLIAGCGMYGGTKKASKDLAEDLDIENPITVSNTKEALANARSQVKKTRRNYEKCLDRNSKDESACTAEKEMYEKSTERYMQLQKTK